MVAMAAAIDDALPLKVPASMTVPPAGVKWDMTSVVPARPATGKPLPIALPNVVRSGITPQISW
jgi:hypothetical protein